LRTLPRASGVPVFLDVRLGGMTRVILGMHGVRMREMGMVGRLLVMPRLVLFRRFLVVLGGFRMVFRCVRMMLRCFLGHEESPLYC
jgi:hypothetical protein